MPIESALLSTSGARSGAATADRANQQSTCTQKGVAGIVSAARPPAYRERARRHYQPLQSTQHALAIMENSANLEVCRDARARRDHRADPRTDSKCEPPLHCCAWRAGSHQAGMLHRAVSRAQTTRPGNRWILAPQTPGHRPDDITSPEEEPAQATVGHLGPGVGNGSKLMWQRTRFRSNYGLEPGAQ